MEKLLNGLNEFRGEEPLNDDVTFFMVDIIKSSKNSDAA